MRRLHENKPYAIVVELQYQITPKGAIDKIDKGLKASWNCLSLVLFPSANMKLEGFMVFTAAGHQELIYYTLTCPSQMADVIM